MILRNLKFFFFLLVGIFLLKWVYEVFGGQESLDLINENKSKLIFIILAHIPTLYFDSLTWVTLIGKSRLTLTWSFIITWIAQASGKFFPTGTITGEFVRVYLGIKKGLSPQEASSSVFADLIVATFSLFLMALLSLIYLALNNKNFFLGEYNNYLYYSLFTIFIGCVFFYLFVRKRLARYLIRKIQKKFNFILKKEIVLILLKLDYSMYQLSKKKYIVFKSITLRLLGWIAGAIEIYVFLWVIGIDSTIQDVILIEAFSGVIRAIAFFIPAGLGVQELAFVIIGEYVGFSGAVSFSIALGRRVREILVGIPALIAWGVFFRRSGKKIKGPIR